MPLQPSVQFPLLRISALSGTCRSDSGMPRLYVAMPVDDIPVEPAGFGTFDNGTFDGMVGDDMNNSINSDENILFDVETLDDNK